MGGKKKPAALQRSRLKKNASALLQRRPTPSQGPVLGRPRASPHGCSGVSEVRTLDRLIHLSGPFPPTVSLPFSSRVFVEETGAFVTQRRPRRELADCGQRCHLVSPVLRVTEVQFRPFLRLSAAPPEIVQLCDCSFRDLNTT